MRAALTCDVTLHRDALELAYAVTNGTDEEIGIFDWIEFKRPDGTSTFPQGSAYVELAERTLLVRKMALPKPDKLHVAAYVPPPASRIAARGRFTERIVLSLPVRVMQPFRAALAGLANAGEVVADRPASATTLRLEIGVFPLGASCQLVAEHPAHPAVLTPLPPGPAVSQQFVLTFDTALERPVDVLDDRSVPWP